MKFFKRSKPATLVLATFGAVLLAGCDAGGLMSSGVDTEALAADPILAEPAVGDLWAAKLDEFSSSDFSDNDGSEIPAAYGLLQVINVTDDSVVVITEMGAWPMASGTMDEIDGDLSAITWDPSEEITIDRADIPGLVESGYILKTRRM